MGKNLLLGAIAAAIITIPSGASWLWYRHSQNQRIERNMEIEAEHIFHQRIKDRVSGKVDFYSGRYDPVNERNEIKEAYVNGHIIESPRYHTREQLEKLIKMGQEDRAVWKAGDIPAHRE